MNFTIGGEYLGTDFCVSASHGWWACDRRELRAAIWRYYVSGGHFEVVGSTGCWDRKLSTAFGLYVSLRYPVLWKGRSVVATTAQPDTVWLRALVRSLVRIFVIVLVFRACWPVPCRSFCSLRLCQMLSLPPVLRKLSPLRTRRIAWARQGLVRRVPQLWVVQEGQSS